jgi:hypothetical protein
MSEQSEITAEVLQFVRDWSRRTDERVKGELKRLRIGVTKDLLGSIKSKVLELGAGRLGIEMSFLDYGRLVDMGAGPGSVDRKEADLRRIINVESPATNRAVLTGKNRKRKVRRAKKFYSRTVYARFNALLGIISGSLVEEAVKIVRETAAEISNDPYADMAMYM